MFWVVCFGADDPPQAVPALACARASGSEELCAGVGSEPHASVVAPVVVDGHAHSIPMPIVCEGIVFILSFV